MADIQFEQQGEEFGHPPEASKGGITEMLIQWGLVSSRKEAEYVLIGLFILAAILAVFIYRRTGSSIPPPLPVSSTASLSQLS